MAYDFSTYCKDKGFFYPSCEIYGGIAGFFDYGHLGTRLKRNFEQAWRSYFLSLQDNFHEIETSQIMHQDVFKASGHLANFTDPVTMCSSCSNWERADHLIERELKVDVEGWSPEQITELLKKQPISCSVCKKGTFSQAQVMNLMFPLYVGAGKQLTAYLRPETAQSAYVNFKLQYELLRKKLPLGLALIGKAFRNEISPRNMTLRLREFTQAELQLFQHPSAIDTHPLFESIKKKVLHTYLVEDRTKKLPVARSLEELHKKGIPKGYLYYLSTIQDFYLNVLTIPAEKFRLRQLNNEEKAFYNKYHFDIELNLTTNGFTEVGGLHYRTNHDLQGHEHISTVSMQITDELTSEKFVPHVLELSFGVDRNVYALLDLNIEFEAQRGNHVLHLPPSLSVYRAAVFPLLKNKEELTKKAREIYDSLRAQYPVLYDETGSIGRRYARIDEIGIPYAITIDFETLETDTVTIRNRDSTQQERISIKEIARNLY